jgi:hypothetical protein
MCAFVSEDKALSRRVIRQLIYVASIYLCETGFWNYAGTKENTERLNAAPDLRIHLSNINPSIKSICKEKQLFTLNIANMWYTSISF